MSRVLEYTRWTLARISANSAEENFLDCISFLCIDVNLTLSLILRRLAVKRSSTRALQRPSRCAAVSLTRVVCRLSERDVSFYGGAFAKLESEPSIRRPGVAVPYIAVGRYHCIGIKDASHWSKRRATDAPLFFMPWRHLVDWRSRGERWVLPFVIRKIYCLVINGVGTTAVRRPLRAHYGIELCLRMTYAILGPFCDTSFFSSCRKRARWTRRAVPVTQRGDYYLSPASSCLTSLNLISHLPTACVQHAGTM